MTHTEASRPVYDTFKALSAGDSQLFTTKHAEMLQHCDRIDFGEECGWFLIFGFQGEDRNERLVVYSHAHSRQDYNNLMSSL